MLYVRSRKGRNKGKERRRNRANKRRKQGWESNGKRAGESGGSYEDVCCCGCSIWKRSRGLRECERGSLGQVLDRVRHHGWRVCFVIGWLVDVVLYLCVFALCCLFDISWFYCFVLIVNKTSYGRSVQWMRDLSALSIGNMSTTSCFVDR